jgi:SAM-dependent methyltransferase
MLSTRQPKVLLDVGCGAATAHRLPALFQGWRRLRLDIDPSVSPDILADASDLSALADGAADAVWCAHTLEHLPAHRVGVALGEIRRVIADDGFACILVPDLQGIAAWIAEDRLDEPVYTSPAGPVSAHDMVYGHGPSLARGHSAMAHRCGFTPGVLTRQIEAAGFAGYSLLRRANFELAVLARRRPFAGVADRDALIAGLGL